MAVRIEKGGWFLIFLIGLGLVGYAAWEYGWIERFVPAARLREAKVPPRADLPPVVATTTTGVAPVALPGSKPGCTDRPEVRFLHWAWNSQMGLMFATGGQQATAGSLMC